MTYHDALAFWHGRMNYEVRAAAPADLKLERLRAVLARLGDPHDRLRVVHVTGTKGKGSTAAMLAAILRAAGYRVGLFTSPHLERVEERIQVDGVPIGEAELAARMADIAAADGDPPATFFEIGTALGFLHFVCRRVDVAVIEVGLGGRFDSTNVVRPVVSVITSIGLDHTAQLGNTLEAIAYQKAGIIKPRTPAVCGRIAAGPMAVIRRVAAANHARLVEAAVDVPYRVGLLGDHQRANAGCAVATVAELRAAGFHVPEAAVQRGLAGVRWPARVEVIRERPTVILDTAHNGPSAEALVATLRQAYPSPRRAACVLAVSSDKPYPDMLRALAGYFAHFHLTKYGNNPRGVPPATLAAALAAVAPHATHTEHPTATEAWAAAAAAAQPADLVCVTGSVFLAGELQPAVRAAGLWPPGGEV